MPPPPDLSHHILPEPVSKEIFQTQILPADLPATLTPHPTRARPLAVLIVGQTGAGKTRTAPAVLSAMNRINPPAHFIADVYKAHHPSYLTLISSPNPAHASPATGPDARKWLAMAAAEAISRKLDVLLESACRHPDDFRDLAMMFGEAGYRVEVVVMAVPAALSRLGILHRFYERLPEAGSGNLPIRLTPVKIHDDSYAGLMSVAEWIDEVDYIDRVLVVRRGNLVACSDDKTETSKLSGKVAEALRRERERPLTPEERKVAVADLEKLEARDGKLAVEVKGLVLQTNIITNTSHLKGQAKLCPPVVASSPGIRISKNTPFTPYIKSDIQLSGRRKQKTPAVAQDLVLHSNTHQTMDYTAREDGNGDSEKSLKHYIGVFDPKTGKLEVVQAKKMVVRGTARAKQASDEAMTAPADYQSFYALKTDLGQTFGTRKAKKAIESVTLNAIDPNKGKAGASPRKSTAADKATLKQIGEITATMASKEELQDIVDQAKPVPRPNLEADAIQDVYDPDEFIGREVLAAVPVKDWIEPTKKGEDVQVYSRHVAARVKKIVDTGNVTKIRLLRYFYFLFLFYTMAQPGKQRGTKRVPPREKLKEKLAPAPQAVIEQIRRKFSDGGEIRKFHSDLLIAHCCALACIIDNFEVDTSKLREDMRLDQKDMNTYFYEIGARVKPVASKEKGSKQQHHIAKLALPLQFPKLRSLAPKRR
ncbi:hypothetical protein K4K54_006205 [Colletotrichum sp. SAR 10_86]|nr:hypothetical protein K4K52_013052 [Colletotrichum sp. SAR 10_76]KAI8223369.1 hypothetical protein K4K54_006205 [Colletotrichum sp. SAR 10_86]